MLRDSVKAYDKKYGTGNFWRPVEGQNQIRILTEPYLYDDEYEGEPAGSFIAYILVRDRGGDDEFALFTLPKSLVRWLADQEDLGKISTYPMPYDVMLFKQTTGKKTTYVSVEVEAANSLAVSSQQLAILGAAKPIAELAEILTEQKLKKLSKGSSRPAMTAHPMPQLQSREEADFIAKKNKAEMNMTYAKFEKDISAALSEAELTAIVEKIKQAQEFNALNDFEMDLLRDIMAKKVAKLRGVEDAPMTSPAEAVQASTDDIRVEDIPF